jgi:hypothetical protein
MFQFPGFASLSRWSAFSGPGCPIRISTDQFLFADPRSFSQLITSFFASESLGIPHTPFVTSFYPPQLLPQTDLNEFFYHLNLSFCAWDLLGFFLCARFCLRVLWCYRQYTPTTSIHTSVTKYISKLLFTTLLPACQWTPLLVLCPEAWVMRWLISSLNSGTNSGDN